MSLDYHVRLNRAFTVAQLVEAAEAALSEVDAAGTARTLVVVPDLHDYLARHAGAVRADDTVLRAAYGGPAGIGPDVIVMTPDTSRVVQVSEFDHGHPDEPELGRRLSVDVALDRTRASRVLAVAVAVAAARLTGGLVVDEIQTLTGQRMSDPEAVVAGVRGRDPVEQPR